MEEDKTKELEKANELIEFTINKARSSEILMAFICAEGLANEFLELMDDIKDDPEVAFTIEEFKSFIPLFCERNGITTKA